MAHRKQSPSLSQSEKSSLSDSEDSRHSPSPRHKNSKKRAQSGRSVQGKTKKVNVTQDTDDDLDEEYFVAARAMTRCYDLFCKVEKLIKIGCLLQQDEAADQGDLEEDEVDKVSRKKRLEGLSTYNYHQLLQLAPGLQALINNKSKSKQLARITRKMNGIISVTRSDDSTRLKSQISHYAAPSPAKEPLSPPVNNGTSSRSHMGVNHPVLASFLCPITAVKDYHQDPAEMQKKLASGQILMSAADFPAYLWEGTPPGESYNDDSMTDGLFKGYFLVHIMRHIFTGLSTALGEDSRATRSCNASLHDMTTVQPEHIAYACVQARFGISSKNKWAEVDGKFNYREFYQNIIDFLRECEDKDWVDSLLKWWNRKLFKTEHGREGAVDEASTNDSSRGSTAPMDSLSKMWAQMSARASATKNLGGDRVRDPPSSPTPHTASRDRSHSPLRHSRHPRARSPAPRIHSPVPRGRSPTPAHGRNSPAPRGCSTTLLIFVLPPPASMFILVQSRLNGLLLQYLILSQAFHHLVTLIPQLLVIPIPQLLVTPIPQLPFSYPTSSHIPTQDRHSTPSASFSDSTSTPSFPNSPLSSSFCDSTSTPLFPHPTPSYIPTEERHSTPSYSFSHPNLLHVPMQESELMQEDEDEELEVSTSKKGKLAGKKAKVTAKAVGKRKRAVESDDEQPSEPARHPKWQARRRK